MISKMSTRMSAIEFIIFFVTKIDFVRNSSSVKHEKKTDFLSVSVVQRRWMVKTYIYHRCSQSQSRHRCRPFTCLDRSTLQTCYSEHSSEWGSEQTRGFKVPFLKLVCFLSLEKLPRCQDYLLSHNPLVIWFPN